MKFQRYILPTTILLLAAALRFFNVTDVPFTHDEFSAIRRTAYESLSDLIKYGVKTDGHPALVQVLLYYYIQWVGPVEHWLKLPFILSGIGAVGLMYSTTGNRLGETSAVVSATLLSLLSYPLYFSQIARPYISGLLLVLLAFYFWQKIVYGNPRKEHFISYGVALALCAYNHHFSALQAAIIGLSGIFCVKPAWRKSYLWSLFGAVVLYVPHLPIFIFQLQKGGVGGPEGWLPLPEGDFIGHYLQYVFHFSWWMYGVVAILFLASVSSFRNKAILRYRLLMLSWFIIPFAIGFAYSYWVNPVLQHSVLLFSFPFLLLFLFGGLPDLKGYQRWVLFMLMAVIGIFSLLKERHYYELFYHSAYEEIVLETQQQEQENLKFINSHPDITGFYAERYGLSSDVSYLGNSANLDSLSRILATSKSTTLTYGGGPNAEEIVLGVLGRFYPYVNQRKYYHNGAFYELSKIEGRSLYKVDRCITHIRDTTKAVEWISLHQGEVSDLISKKYDVMDASMMIGKLPEDAEVYWIWQVQDLDDTMLYWQAKEIFTDSPGKEHYKYFSLYMRDKDFPPNAVIKVMLWNKSKTPLQVMEACLRVREGNPVQFGLYHPIP